MEAEEQKFRMLNESPGLRYNDPMVIGASALVLGFAIGSGRWSWFGRGAGRLADSLASLALIYIKESLHQHHPELFPEHSRVTH